MKCDRCGKLIEDAAFVTVHIGSPLMEDHAHSLLCGKCSIELGEFLVPDLLKDGDYNEAKAALLQTMKANDKLRSQAAQRHRGRHGHN